ncbi:MAG TPA: PTS system mannose/fructose/sorbose family transporter subunit IID [Gemmatimonadales bacterium]|jgi:PTS system mannose-specific IID component
MIAGFLQALRRLFLVQGAWSYERMTGVGIGYASEPLLEDLRLADPTRHAEAAVRSAEYFNSHPYLAGLAVGALVRAEYDQVPGAQVSRLRSALTSPLGALGDQLFWAGLVPALMGLGILGVVAGLGPWILVAVVVVYNAVRVATTWWALSTGLASGVHVGSAIARSWLPRAAPLVGLVAGGSVGIALPLAARWLLPPRPHAMTIALGTLAVALLAVWPLGPRVNPVRFGVGAIGLAALLAWGLP